MRPDPTERHVTIVEDDVSLLSALTFALEADGFSVSPFTRAAELLAKPPRTDCLVIDLKLPDADGLALIKDLRQRGVAAPAILITTNPDLRSRSRAADAGVEIVEKPLMGSELRRRIDAAMAS